MPVYYDDEYSGWEQVAAWKAHYIAKGCHPIKASALARRKRGWPKGVGP